MILRNVFTIFLLCLFAKVTAQKERSLFEEDLDLICMKFSPSSRYTISNNKRPMYVTDDYSCPLRRLGTVHSILTNLDGQCKVFVYLLGAHNIRYGGLVKANKELFGEVSSSIYSRTKYDLKYGRPNTSASVQDIEDLKMMMTFYPQDIAKSFFNANHMMTYPYNMEGKKYEEDFTRVRVVAIEKNGINVFFYFAMTDKGIKNFDKYIADFKGVFWFD